MKIEEARQLYNFQIKSFHQKQLELARQKNELEQKINTTPDGKSIFVGEAAVLELSTRAVDEKLDAYLDNLLFDLVSRSLCEELSKVEVCYKPEKEVKVEDYIG